jgi:site-specific DNA recombinase
MTHNPRHGHLDVSKVAVIYMRVSDPKQEQMYSLPQQEADARRHCESHDYEIHHTYNDGAQHSWTLDRAGLDAVREDVRAGRAGVVVVGKFDRFSRNQRQMMQTIWELEDYGARVESANEPTVAGLMGQFMQGAYGLVAEQELENIRFRTQNGRRGRAQSGKLIPSRFPLFGYIWADPTEKHGKTRYLIDEITIDGDPEHAAAQIVRRLFADLRQAYPCAPSPSV